MQVLFVTPNTELTAKKIYDETEEARNKISFDVNVFNNNTGETNSVTISAHQSDMADRVLDEYTNYSGLRGAEYTDNFGNPLDSSLRVDELETDKYGPVRIYTDGNED